MKHKIKSSLSLILCLISLNLFASNQWGIYWGTNLEANLGSNYCLAINDLLNASAERYRLCTYVTNNFQMPVVIDYGVIVTNTISGGVTNWTIIQNQSNAFFTNDVSYSSYVAPNMDLPHYGLFLFDIQFQNMLNAAIPYTDNHYWLDTTKTTNYFIEYLQGAQTNIAVSWQTDRWVQTKTTNYLTLPNFDVYNFCNHYLTNDSPIYKLFYPSSGTKRKMLGYEYGPGGVFEDQQIFSYYADPEQWIIDYATNDPTLGTLCVRIADKGSLTNVLAGQATFGKKNWLTAFNDHYPLSFTLPFSNLPYSNLAEEWQSYAPSNYPNGTQTSNRMDFVFAGWTNQICDTPYSPTTNPVPYYRGSNNWVIVAKSLYYVGQNDYPWGWDHQEYVLARSGTNIPENLSQSAYSPYPFDRWQLSIYKKNSPYYLKYFAPIKTTTNDADIVYFYFTPANTTTQIFLGGSWMDLQSAAQIEEQGWSYISHWAYGIADSYYNSHDLITAPVYDPAKIGYSDLSFKYFQANSNLPMSMTYFDIDATQFIFENRNENFLTPYSFTNITKQIFLQDHFVSDVAALMDVASCGNTNYDRVITNYATPSFYNETNEYDRTGDYIEFRLKVPADLFSAVNAPEYYGFKNFNYNITADLLNERREALVSLTKLYRSEKYAGWLETRTMSNSYPEVSTSASSATDYSSFSDLWMTIFDDMSGHFENNNIVSNFVESPSLLGEVSMWQKNEIRAYPAEYNNLPPGQDFFRAAVNGGFHYSGYPEKNRISPVYLFYPANPNGTNLNIKSVVAFAQRVDLPLGFEGDNGYANLLAEYGSSITNWFAPCMWTNQGGYAYSIVQNANQKYTMTNGNNYISSGLIIDNFASQIYEDIMAINEITDFSGWGQEILEDEWGFYGYKWRGSWASSWSLFTAHFDTPAIFGLIEPDYEFGDIIEE